MTVFVAATLVRQLKIWLVHCLLKGSSRACYCSTSSALSDASLLAFLGSKTKLSRGRLLRIRFSGPTGCRVCRLVSSRKWQQRLGIRAVAQTSQRLKQDRGRGRPESARHTQYAIKRCYIASNPSTTMYDRTAGRVSPTSIYQTHFFRNFLVTSFQKPLETSRTFRTILNYSRLFQFLLLHSGPRLLGSLVHGQVQSRLQYRHTCINLEAAPTIPCSKGTENSGQMPKFQVTVLPKASTDFLAIAWLFR